MEAVRRYPRGDSREPLSDMVDGRHPPDALLSQAWLSLGHPDAPDAEALADKLETLEKTGRLGRPGPIGIKLFPDIGQIARDLAAQLRIHAAAMNFCKAVEKNNANEKELLDQLTRYCLLSLQWRKKNRLPQLRHKRLRLLPPAQSGSQTMVAKQPPKSRYPPQTNRHPKSKIRRLGSRTDNIPPDTLTRISHRRVRRERRDCCIVKTCGQFRDLRIITLQAIIR